MRLSFAHKGLRAFYEDDTTKGIRTDQAKRIRNILTLMDEATSLDDMALPSLKLHPLKGDRAGEWAVKVNGPWRITFTPENDSFTVIDLENYHEN